MNVRKSARSSWGSSGPRFTWAPIRKLVVGAATSGIVYVAHRYLGLDFGPEGVEEVVTLGLGYAAAYAVKDPRVASLARELSESELAALIEAQVLDALARVDAK